MACGWFPLLRRTPASSEVVENVPPARYIEPGYGGARAGVPDTDDPPVARPRPLSPGARLSRRLQTYEGEGFVVTFDPAICIHSGKCVRGLPAVFDVRRKRWIAVEAATPAEIEAQVARCPSGALQFRRTSE